MTTATASSSTTDPSPMARLKRDKFALLARVGHLGREVSALHAEADLYCSTATELLAASLELLMQLEAVEAQEGAPRKELVIPVSRVTNSIRRLLNFWPKNTMSQDRVLEMLDSDGVEMGTVVSDDGYVYLSSDLILSNAARAIGATKGQLQKPSSNSEARTRFVPAGTSGNESLRLSLL